MARVQKVDEAQMFEELAHGWESGGINREEGQWIAQVEGRWR